MASVQYTVKLSDGFVTTMYRQIVDEDGSVLAESPVKMAEVRSVPGSNAVDEYLEAVADRLMAAVTALRDADNRPDSTTFDACGKAYVDLQQLLTDFDTTLLPPINTL
jgi:hypothetical protein